MVVVTHEKLMEPVHEKQEDTVSLSPCVGRPNPSGSSKNSGISGSHALMKREVALFC